jgi:putative tricarboxylic transport membrane protein
MQLALRESGLVRQPLQVENIAGAAGTIGLAQFVTGRRGDGGALLVTGLVMLGAILTNAAPVSLADTTPIARLTGEYEVVVVPARSRFQSLGALLDALRRDPGSISWGGGSAGGTDHILAGMIAAEAGLDPRRVNYIAFSGGGEALAALLGEQVTVGVSGYGEFQPHLESGALRALAISSRARVDGIAVPTLREQGIEIELANWRGVVAPPAIGVVARRDLDDRVGRLARSDAWRRILRQRGWLDLYLSADDFARFLRLEQARIARVVDRLQTARPANAPPAGIDAFGALVLGGGAFVAAALAVGHWRTRDRRPTPPAERTDWRALALVAGGLAITSALIDRAGFVAAATLLFAITARAFGSRRTIRDGVVAVIFAAAVYLAFTRGLGLMLP